MIIKNLNIPITNNFKMSEFYSGSFNAPEEHYLHDGCVQVAQYLRDITSAPVLVSSTFRTFEHNIAIGGASNSQHIKGTAIDLKITDKDHFKAIKKDIEERGELFQVLLNEYGVRGFGLYDTFIHLDFRLSGNHNYNGIGFAYWNMQTKKK